MSQRMATDYSREREEICTIVTKLKQRERQKITSWKQQVVAYSPVTATMIIIAYQVLFVQVLVHYGSKVHLQCLH